MLHTSTCWYCAKVFKGRDRRITLIWVSESVNEEKWIGWTYVVLVMAAQAVAFASVVTQPVCTHHTRRIHRRSSVQQYLSNVQISSLGGKEQRCCACLNTRNRSSISRHGTCSASCPSDASKLTFSPCTHIASLITVSLLKPQVHGSNV